MLWVTYISLHERNNNLLRGFHTSITFYMYNTAWKGGITLKKYLLLILMCTLLVAPVAYAHTMDKSTLYTDVAATGPNIQEIMVLNSLGLLGYNNKDMALNPTENLSRKDFASWIGIFYGLEGANAEELAQAAHKEDYVSSLDGDVTYKELNTALFHNKLELEKPDATLTKEEYIAFLTKNLDVDMDGHTLLQMGGFSYGPTGTIEDVVTDDEEIGVVINGETYMFSGHPRIFADSTEPKSWVGQTLEKSISTTHGGHHHGNGHEEHTSNTPTLQYIQIGTGTPATNEENNQNHHESAATSHTEHVAKEEPKEVSSSNKTLWFGSVIVILIALLGLLFWKPKK